MDTTTLVSDLIDDGQRIIEKLSQDGFEVIAAFWVKKADEDGWSFHIISSVDDPNLRLEAYGQLHSIIRRLPEPHWIDPLEVRLIGPSHTMARDVLAIHERSAGSKVCPIRWGGTRLGNVDVEGAYLYPLPVTAS